MMQLAMMMDDLHSDIAMYAFLSVGAVALFVIFIPTVTWLNSRRMEREAYYKAETLRRLAESSGDGAKAALEMLREEDRRKRISKREGLKVGGMINLGVGIGLTIFLHAMMGGGNTPYLAGLIPGFIGLAMLIYVFFMAGPVE
jgi:hypothetical protein